MGRGGEGGRGEGGKFIGEEHGGGDLAKKKKIFQWLLSWLLHK